MTWAERPDLAERGPPSEAVWPEYNLHGASRTGGRRCSKSSRRTSSPSTTTPRMSCSPKRTPVRSAGTARSAARRHRRCSATGCLRPSRRPPDQHPLCARRRSLPERAPARPGRRTAAGHARARRPPPTAAADRPRPTIMEGALPAHTDRALHHLAPRGRPTARPLDAPARTPRRARRHGTAALDAHHRHRPRLGDVDRPGAPGIGRLRVPAWPCSPQGRPATPTWAPAGSPTSG